MITDEGHRLSILKIPIQLKLYAINGGNPYKDGPGEKLMSILEFRTQKWKGTRIDSYTKRASAPRQQVLRDTIAYAILKEQGFSIPQDAASIYDPQKLYDALALFAPSRDVKFKWDKQWDAAFKRTFKVFAKGKNNRPLHVDMSVNTVRKAIKMEKSAGLPLLNSKEEDFYYALNRADQVLKGIKAPTPCIAYARTSHGEKTRLVWGYPLEMTIIESTFARPLTDLFLSRRTTMAFGMSKFCLGSYVSKIDSGYGVTRSIDYSKFDSSISSIFIEKAFEILKTWFTQEDLQKFGWDRMVNYFLTTPILMPNGKVYRGKKHGVPSGSYFTQMIDSVVNTMLQFYLALEHGYSLSWEKFLVLGDDVIVSIPAEISLDDISITLRKVGITMHPDKCREDVHFLGAVWVKGIPYRDIGEILSRMVYTENFRMYKGESYDAKRYEAYGMMMNFCSQYANASELLPRPTGYRHDLLEDMPDSYRDYVDKTKGFTSYGRYHAEYLDNSKQRTSMISSRLLS